MNLYDQSHLQLLILQVLLSYQCMLVVLSQAKNKFKICIIVRPKSLTSQSKKNKETTLKTAERVWWLFIRLWFIQNFYLFFNFAIRPSSSIVVVVCAWVMVWTLYIYENENHGWSTQNWSNLYLFWTLKDQATIAWSIVNPNQG